ncbi:MAG TPA: M48 family metalloprotease [Thermomicrobiales bacterium]|nr:M48 family metalloprotease [Thermomicrobiales bacterium]
MSKMKSIVRHVLLSTMLAAPFVLVGALLAGVTGAVGGLLLAAAAQVTAWMISRPVLLRMARAAPANPERHAALIATVERLAAAARIPMPLVAISELHTPNAFAAATPGGGIVGVTAGLLEMLTDDELEAVVAHEIAHLARGDRMTATLAAMFTALPGVLITSTGSDLFYGVEFRRSHHRIWGGRRLRVVRDGLALATVPMAALVVRVSVSRVAELKADADAVRLTRNVGAMISSLRKINVLAGRVISPVNPALSHMLVVHPYGEQRIGRLFDTHPSLQQRLNAIESALEQDGAPSR